MSVLDSFLGTTGFATMTSGHLMMIVIGIIFITLAITKDYEPLLLLPIGFGINSLMQTSPLQAVDLALVAWTNGERLITIISVVNSRAFRRIGFTAGHSPALTCEGVLPLVPPQIR